MICGKGWLYMDRVCIEVNITEEDMHKFQKAVLFQKVPLPAIIAIGVIFALFEIQNILNAVIKGENILFSVVILILPALFLLRIAWFLKKSPSEAIKTNKFLQKTQRYEISNEGMSIIRESSKKVRVLGV